MWIDCQATIYMGNSIDNGQQITYADLLETNRGRSREEMEYELLGTGVFNEDRYFDVFVEYAKEGRVFEGRVGALCLLRALEAARIPVRMKATQLLHNLGQSIWLDNITRDLLTKEKHS